MRKWLSRYKQFSNKEFALSVVTSLVMLIASLVLNFYAGLYATEKASSPVTDIILNNIPVVNLDGVFITGSVLFWIFVALLCFADPKKTPFILKSISLFVLIRSIFISLTHIGPFPDQISLDLSGLIGKFIFGGDLFFSGHTGLPFLMALVFWRQKLLRIFFILSSLVFGAVVLFAHLHYSIDVFAAFFITYTIFHIAERFFKKDQLYFHGTQS